MRLLSYNIHKGIGGRDRQYRIQRVIDVVLRESPDIVCLQEVDRNVQRSKFDDQPRVLAQALGMAYRTYQFNHKVKKGGYGNLVLSRFEISQKHNVNLRMKTRKNRRGQVVIINTPAGPLRVVNWHLGLGEKERHWQVNKLLNNKHYREYAALPTLVAGDSNDWRNTLHKGPFAEHGLAQISSPPSKFRSFPAYMPVGALDKAFCCERINVQRAHVSASKLARQASDHLPLVIDFKFR